MPSDYANLPPSPDDQMFVVEGTVDPPIEGDPDVALVTIQPDAEQARKRFEVHFAQLNRITVEGPEVTPIEEHPEFQEADYS